MSNKKQNFRNYNIVVNVLDSYTFVFYYYFKMNSSSTNTKHSSVLKEKMRATRPLDYIYDPLYTFSGPKDYYKTAYESFQSSSVFSVQPIYESMFSDMLRYPRASLVLKSSHRVPSYIDTSYGGKLKAAEEQSSSTAEVSGVDRFKFFKRPTTESSNLAPPVTSRFPMLGIESLTKLGPLAPPTTAYVQLPSSPAKQQYFTQTKAIQTDFREVETQTRPWTPPFVTKDSENPEILTLDTLRWGQELPPGIHTVEIIEHARMKKAWEDILPPIDSVKNIKRRYKMISDMEKASWNFRDEEIQYIHNMRLKEAEQTMASYKNMKAEILEQKIKWISQDRYKEKNRKIKLIEHSKARALRKLSMKERGYNPKYHKMNITDELDDYASQVYAPFQRWGTNFRNKHEVLTNTEEIKIDYSDRKTYMLENIRPKQIKFDVDKASQPRKQVDLCFRETRWTEENLDKLHADLKAIRLKDDMVIEKRPLPMIEKILKQPKPREISSVKEVSEYDRKVYNSLVMLQKVIRGRAIQVELFKERTRWQGLIEELMQTSNVEENPKTDVNTYNKQILKYVLEDKRKNLEQICRRQETDPRMLEDIAEGVNLLSKELLRFKDEKEVHDLVLDVEYERWRREAAESGRRQKEIQRRKEHEEIYNKLTDMHEKTANSFMNVVCNEARTSAAEFEAERFVQEVADKRDAESYAAYCRNDNQEKEIIATQLLYNFVLPESKKAILRQTMQERNQKNLLAIHEHIFGQMNKEKIEEIPGQAFEFVDEIIDEALLKLCYRLAEDLVQSTWNKAKDILQDRADTSAAADYVIEELLKTVCNKYELEEYERRPSSGAVIEELLNAVCIKNSHQENTSQSISENLDNETESPVDNDLPQIQFENDDT